MSKNKSETAPEEVREGGFWETFKTISVAILIALVIRTFAYEPFNIPSGSMKSTLLIGDYLFVSKSAYGYSRYSFDLFGWDIVPPSLGDEGNRMMFSEPKRGDVAVFKLPSDNKTDYIKRIVGLPGDRIQVTDGVLIINGVALKRERVGDFIGGAIRQRGLREVLEAFEDFAGFGQGRFELRGVAEEVHALAEDPPIGRAGQGEDRLVRVLEALRPLHVVQEGVALPPHLPELLRLVEDEPPRPPGHDEEEHFDDLGRERAPDDHIERSQRWPGLEK